MKTMVINTQERAVSTDVNRLQKFIGRDVSEVLRQLFTTSNSFENPGVEALFSGTTPLPAEILGGLLVKPQTNSLNLLIDAGVLAAYVNDGEADESSLKLINDAGVTLPGSLVMTTNASGSIRIDVIECSIDSTPTLVTDNRDIFNTITGLFQASTVTKEKEARLTFRVRTGTPGAGMPVHQAGWLPLAVASVPDGATTCNDMTFWDVRPLIADRERSAFVGDSTMLPRLLDNNTLFLRVSAGSALLNGQFRATLRGRMLGGYFRRGTPGTDADSIDVADADNQEGSGTIAEPLTGHAFLYACTPKGLPRWAMYAPHPAARLPRSPVGLLVTSYVSPDPSGAPSAVVALPDSTGLGGDVEVEEAVCVAIIPSSRSAEGAWFPYNGPRREARVRQDDTYQPTLVSAAVSSGLYDFTITEDFWPANAKFLHVRIRADFEVPTVSGIDGLTRLYVWPGAVSGAGKMVLHDGGGRIALTNSSVGSETYNISRVYRIPRPCLDPAAAPASFVARFEVPTSAIFGSSPTPQTYASMDLIGWEL